jgi:hypothetical protein
MTNADAGFLASVMRQNVSAGSSSMPAGFGTSCADAIPTLPKIAPTLMQVANFRGFMKYPLP